MVKAILGRKLRMTQMFLESGVRVPLTAIEVGPCPVVQIKTADKDGYNAIQIGFDPIKEKNANKPTKGHFAKAKTDPTRLLKEIRVDKTDEYEVGKNLDATVFEEGDHLDVTGISKGRGFAGGMRRHNWGGGRATHGSMFHRRIGAVAQGTGLSRVVVGKSMPGHMGHETVTLQNLELVKVDAENGVIFVKGGIPGPSGGFVYVKATTKNIVKKEKK